MASTMSFSGSVMPNKQPVSTLQDSDLSTLRTRDLKLVKETLLLMLSEKAKYSISLLTILLKLIDHIRLFNFLRPLRKQGQYHV